MLLKEIDKIISNNLTEEDYIYGEDIEDIEDNKEENIDNNGYNTTFGELRKKYKLNPEQLKEILWSLGSFGVVVKGLDLEGGIKEYKQKEKQKMDNIKQLNRTNKQI